MKIKYIFLIFLLLGFCKNVRASEDLDRIRYLRKVYLVSGDLEKGFELEKQLCKEEEKGSMRLWQGQNLGGKTIYIFDNIGMGDVFCFIQFAKKMKAQGATVILGVRQSLIPIMSSYSYIDKIVPRFCKAPEYDFYIYMHKLPRMAYKAGFWISNQELSYEPYLFANKELIKKWKNKLSQDKNFKIGICWDASVQRDQSGKIMPNRRSIPLRYFYELSKIEGVSLYSLQRMNGTEQLDMMPKDFKIYTFDGQFDKEYGSFSDTAAVMKNLDLVISVDTSIAHLAGALGVPIWMLLNKTCNWRWFLNRQDSPWYPMMRIFRQPQKGNWDAVMDNVLRVIIEKIKN